MQSVHVASLPESAQKFLALVVLPSPLVNKGTDYECCETPYCCRIHSNDQTVLRVVFSEAAHNSSWMGGEDNYSRSEYYEIPASVIGELLNGISPGGERRCAGGWVKVFCEDHAYGYDCAEPHDFVSYPTKRILLFAELSEDQQTATLDIVRSVYNVDRKSTLEMHVHLCRTTHPEPKKAEDSIPPPQAPTPTP